MDSNSSRPMSYDSLKVLLQHAKPNLRFELSRRCPSIRMTEKVVPLRIDKLLIGKYGVEVDDIKYEARVQRHYLPNDPELKDFDFNYTSRDGDWDMDEWGFDDFSSDNVITPGDLVFQAEGQLPRQADRSDGRKREIENHLKFVQWTIAKKSGENVDPEWTGGNVAHYFRTLCEEASLMKLKCDAEELKIELAPFNFFENNVPLPFTKTIQVAFGSTNRGYTGNLKCSEVRKQLLTWLLGNRKPVIHVNHLIVNNGIIARLPQDLQISVKTLQIQNPLSYRIPVNTTTMLNKLGAIIHNQDRPLEVFETDSIDEDFDHPMATTAKKLVYSPRSKDSLFANRIIRIPNQKMHVSCSNKGPVRFEPEGIMRLIRNWMENPREIGKRFSFDGLEKRVIKAMTRIQAAFDGIKTKRSIKIPVNNVSQISVTYGTQFLCREKRLRLLTIEVVPA